MGAGKYLTFALDTEEYAVPVLKVREIIKMMDITNLPQMPPYVKGVINLRGRIVPIVDVRLKFGLPARDYSDRTCIIVVEVAARDAAARMGVIVDSVCDVLSISVDEVSDAPEFGNTAGGAWVEALARVKGRVKILLNLDKMLGTDGQIIRAA